MHPDLNVFTSKNYHDLQRLPEEDWLDQIYGPHFEDANDWLFEKQTDLTKKKSYKHLIK
jgi:hypothetical protein